MRDYIKLSDQYSITFHFLEAEYDHSEIGKMWLPEQLVIEDIGKIYYEDVTTDKCLQRLDDYIKTNHIDVLFGFSQGGNIVDTYLRNYVNNIKCAVIISGYSFLYRTPNKRVTKYDIVDGKYNYTYELETMELLNIPLLNIYSESDKIVASKHRPTMYKRIQDIKYETGHRHPTTKLVICEILEWIRDECHAK